MPKKQKKIKVNKEELKQVLDILLDIAEEHYPQYYSSDNIAICNDFYKEIWP